MSVIGLEFFPALYKRRISLIIIWAAKRGIIIAVKKILVAANIFPF